MPVPNSLWRIVIDNGLATYIDNSIKLEHVKSDKFLGIYYWYYDNINGKYVCDYNKSPSTNHTEGNKLKYICLFY
jgi:hypothetical protein